MTKRLFYVLLFAVAAILLFLLGRSCGYHAGIGDGQLVTDSIRYWVDKEGLEHAAIPVTTGSTAAEVFTKQERKELREVTRGGKVSSVTEIGTTRMIPCREYVTKIIQEPVTGTEYVVVVDSVDRPVEAKDTVTLVHYWKRRQLYADVKSAQGSVDYIKAKAVYKEPLVVIGPSVSGVYYNGFKVVPGISATLNLGPLLFPRKVR